MWGLMKAAMRYAQSGLAVFPLKPMGKSPDTPHGVKDATTDVDRVFDWWNENPDRNIGIATGSASGGLVVIDIDLHGGANGFDTIFNYEMENTPTPATIRSRTGSGGAHWLFRADRTVRNCVGGSLGLDVRGEGGYIVAPPSVHQNGNAYWWMGGQSSARSVQDIDFENEIAAADDSVFALIDYIRSGGRKAVKREGAHGFPAFDPSERFMLPGVIREGERNDTLFRYACSLWASGEEASEVQRLVSLQNAVSCIPPMDEREIERIVSHVTTDYPRGH